MESKAANDGNLDVLACVFNYHSSCMGMHSAKRVWGHGSIVETWNGLIEEVGDKRDPVMKYLLELLENSIVIHSNIYYTKD